MGKRQRTERADGRGESPARFGMSRSARVGERRPARFFRARKLRRRETAAYRDGGARCGAQDRLTLPPGRSDVTGTKGKALAPQRSAACMKRPEQQPQKTAALRLFFV